MTVAQYTVPFGSGQTIDDSADKAMKIFVEATSSTFKYSTTLHPDFHPFNRSLNHKNYCFMRSCYTILLLLLLSVTAMAQTTIFDFEGADPTFEDFNGSATTFIANPDMSAPNTSAKVAQNVIPSNQNFAGIKITQNIDLADGKTFTMQVWSPIENAPVLLKFEGSATGPDIERGANFTGAANSWQELTLDFDGEADHLYTFVVVFMNFNVNTNADPITFYWDNLTQGGASGPTVPQAAAATPTAPAAEVVSIFSDAYDDVTVDTYRTDWSAGDLLDTTIEGNATIKYSNLDFVGIETATNPVDLTAATTMHLDYWSVDGTAFAVKLVDFGADGAFGGGDDVEHQLDVTGLTRRAWNSIDLPLDDFTGLTTRSNVGQYILVGMPTGTHTIFIDNIYFYQVAPIGEQMDLPVTFDEEGVDYGLVGFGGSNGAIVADPEDATNMVGQVIKTAGAALWAGVTMTSANDAAPVGFANRIPFSAGETVITARVWSPAAGVNIRLKAEKNDDPTISVETDANTLTTVAGGWEMLTFDFSTQADGTAAINFASVYDKLSIFMDFGNDMPAAEATYYFDDVIYTGEGGGGGTQMELPVTFDEADVDYGLVGFGGSNGEVVADPGNAANMVGQVIKNAGAEVWAGVTMTSNTGGPDGFASAIPFAAGATIITARVWSPNAGTNVLMKAEQTDDATVSVETSAMTTVAGGWEVLTFDFSNEADGTAALNLDAVYGKLSIFLGFGNSPAAEETYYFDDVTFGEGEEIGTQMDLPVTFEDEGVDYGVADFGGNESMIVADPEDATNTVVQSTKTAGAETWGGTTLTSSAAGGLVGFASQIPFTADATKMSVSVWSPTAGTPVLLKVENKDDGTISVETLTSTTVAGEWEVLVFDFSMEATGTAALNLDNVYDKASIFFDFGTSPTEATTYYWDDVYFGDVVGTNEPIIGLLEAFPNPVGGAVSITAPERMQSLTLFSITGQVVGKWTPETEQFDVEMGHLAPGNYVALVRTKQGLMTIKLLKQ